MERMLERVAGLDVHKKPVAVGVRVPGPRGSRAQEVRTFGTTTAELLALRDWLETQGVTHVAMESTGVYWKPVFYVLEEAVTCLLANAAHIALVEAALSASRARNSALAARYRRIMRHRGHKKAVVAVAYAMLVSIYNVLGRHVAYRDLGPDYYGRLRPEQPPLER